MYEDQYGLTGRPFALTPDPRFWFDTATHRKAMAYLGYGLSQGEGFIVITGDIGAGKTTLVGHLVETIDPAALNVITLVSTQMAPEDLLRLVADGLGVEARGLAKAELLKRIEQGLHAVARSGRRTLLIVDEVQALPTESLEELRMLSNIQAGGHPLLQIILLGQPEFRDRLHGSERLEQLRQRVIAIHHLDPMQAEEIEPYMIHRLSMVGWQGRPAFTRDAFEALHEATGGVPRLVNQLAGRVMLFAAMDRLDTIDAAVVDAVIDDLAADIHHPAPQPLADAENAAAAPANDEAMRRIALLETRVEEQDAALRRVLTLLVDWVEGGDSRGERASANINAA
jgi:putative secretion ATPase (PEP-CTERM system associated)